MKTQLLLPLAGLLVAAGLTSCEGGLFDLMAPSDSLASVSGVWTAANSPYRISTDLKVYPGDTLIIEPGVEVIFQNLYGNFGGSLAIEGCLKVLGTETDSVRFTAEEPATGWGGLRFWWPHGLNEINYASIQHGHNGISCSYGTDLIMRHCTISYCQAEYEGGGIQALCCSSLRLENCLISHCTAQNGGGLSLQYCNGAEIDSCVFFDNFASGIYGGGVGGGILCESSAATFTRNIIYSNVAQDQGAGLYAAGNTLALINNTIALNRNVCAGDSSVGAGVFASWATQISGSSNIIFFNAAPQQSQWAGSGNVNLTFSCIGDSLPGIGNLTANPQFADTAAGNFALLPSSPCIDTGDPASPLDPDGTRADMGAIYFQH